MCGIVGYISLNDKQHEKAKDYFMYWALTLDTLRGYDSTGLMTLTNDFDLHVKHSLLPGNTFVNTKAYKDHFVPGWAQFGHNRAATKGEVKLANAHPFTFGDITMVHNGTLWGDGKSIETFDKSLEVDSMQIALGLSKTDVDKTAQFLSTIDGAFALAWFDKRDSSVNVARNGDRPLHFGYSTNRDIVWFMSDGGHLHTVTRGIRNHESCPSTVYQLDKHLHLKWKKGSTVPEVTKFDPFAISQRPKPALSQTKLSEATQKWSQSVRDHNRKKHLSASGTPTKDDGKTGLVVPLKIMIDGTRRKIPTAQAGALRSEYDLGEQDLLEFQMQDSFQLPDGDFRVYGKIIHRRWADCEWEAVIESVKKIQVGAYAGMSWLVRPIGVTNGLTIQGSDPIPAILCHLVHCNWESAKQRVLEEDEAADEGKDDAPIGGASHADMHIAGPDGQHVSVRILQKKVDRGCVSCGGSLSITRLQGCTYVNGGEDILCRPCQDDLVKNGIMGLQKELLN